MSETITEGWVTFRRVQCKEGTLDRWVGDCADDPNRKTQSKISLNMMVGSYRFDGKGYWIPDDCLERDIQQIFHLYHMDYTSQEIYENMLKPVEYQHYVNEYL